MTDTQLLAIMAAILRSGEDMTNEYCSDDEGIVKEAHRLLTQAKKLTEAESYKVLNHKP